MKTTSARHFTARDYRMTPDGPPWWQLIEGELIQDPSPNVDHQRIARNVLCLLNGYAGQKGLGEVLGAPMDVWLSDENVFQPDVLFLSRSRRTQLAHDGVHGAPDLVVEILSPSTAGRDAGQKRRIYAASGVREFWIMDPQQTTVTVFRFAEDAAQPVQTAGQGESFRSPLFPRLRIAVDSLFAGLRD